MTSSPAPPENIPIQRMAFDERAFQAIASSFETNLEPALFRIEGAEVFRILIPNREMPTETKVTFWPSIQRVDASNSFVTAVMTHVVAVDLVGKVEVQFHRAGGELLIVTYAGKVIVKV